METVKKEINSKLVEIFNSALKLEEKSLRDKGVTDLSMSEVHVIEAIYNTPEKTMSNVAAKLDVTPGTLTTSVDKLIKKGYVTKKVSKLDKRIHLLQLNSSSIEVINKHTKFHENLIDSLFNGEEEINVEAFKVAISNIGKFFNSLK